MLAGTYYQLDHANSIIREKIPTYGQVKEAAIWMKENSNSQDIIATASTSQTSFYAERKILSYYFEKEHRYYEPQEFFEVVKQVKPKFLVVSIFEPAVPQWTYNFPNNYSTYFNPVKVWYTDKEQTQPMLVIYEYLSDNSQSSKQNITQSIE